MGNKFKNALKGVKRYMDKKIETCKEILSSAQNRLVIGLIFGGLSVGLIASAYIHIPT